MMIVYDDMISYHITSHHITSYHIIISKAFKNYFSEFQKKRWHQLVNQNSCHHWHPICGFPTAQPEVSTKELHFVGLLKDLWCQLRSAIRVFVDVYTVQPEKYMKNGGDLSNLRESYLSNKHEQTHATMP